MDLMVVRRALLMMGGSTMVGQFSKYERKSLTFSNASNSASTWATAAIVPCSFVPKLIVISGGTENASNIIDAVMYFGSIGIGVTAGLNSSNVEQNVSYVLNSTSSSGRFYYDETDRNAYIARSNSGIYWSNTDTYTVEIYG